MKNTISQFKRYIGKKFSDPTVQEDIKDMQYEVVQQADDKIGIKVHLIYTLVTFYLKMQVLLSLNMKLKIFLSFT